MFEADPDADPRTLSIINAAHLEDCVALAGVCVSAQPLFHGLRLHLPEGSGQGEGFSTVHSEPVNFHCRDEGGGGWGILSHVLFDNKKQQCLLRGESALGTATARTQAKCDAAVLCVCVQMRQ